VRLDNDKGFLSTGRKQLRTKTGRHIFIIHRGYAKKLQAHLVDAQTHNNMNKERRKAGKTELPKISPLLPLTEYYELDESNTEDFFALDSTCWHAKGPLATGDIEEIDGKDCVKCPWHQKSVTLESGELLQEKGVACDKSDRKVVSSGAVQRTHRITLHRGWAHIHVGVASEGGVRAEMKKALIDSASNGDMNEGEVCIHSDRHAFIETEETRKVFGSKLIGLMDPAERERLRGKQQPSNAMTPMQRTRNERSGSQGSMVRPPNRFLERVPSGEEVRTAKW